MPRRIEYPEAYYHLMNHGLSRNYILLQDKDQWRFLFWIYFPTSHSFRRAKSGFDPNPLIALKKGDQDHEGYGDYAGLGFRRPFLGVAMSLFMLSLAGFTGKFYLFRSAVVAGYTDLAIIGALNSLLSVIYYLRVIVTMYMEEGGVEGKPFARAPYLYLAIAIAALGTMYLGLLPAKALDLSRLSFLSLR